MKKIFQIILSLLVLSGILVGCQNKATKKTADVETKLEKPVEWSRNANI